MRVVVIGGSGHVGSRAVAALSRLSGIEVVSAGRRGPCVVDLARPETFAALVGADAVVDASDSHAVAPDALVRHALAKGLLLFEASSDRRVVERLLDAHRGAASAGTLVLGAGIFTGLSNLLAARAAALLPGAETLTIGVATSPLSGAGRGTVSLMTDALAMDAVRFEGGRRIAGPPVGRGPELPFPGGARATLAAAFPEPAMVHASTGVPSVSMALSPLPGLMRVAFLLTPLFLLRSALYRALLGAYLGFLRRVVLRAVPTKVELVAKATRGSDERVVSLATNDGMEAAGAAIAAMVACVTRGAPTRRGAVTIDELVGLHEVVETMRELAPRLRLDVAE